MRGPKSETTFDAQSTFFLPVPGRKRQLIFMADRWNPADLANSQHIWLPVAFRDGLPVIEWTDRWDLSWFASSERPSQK